MAATSVEHAVNIPGVLGSRFRRLSAEGSWLVFGQACAMLGSLVLVRVLTGRLDPEQYGRLALSLTMVALINQVVMGGVVSGVGRFYPVAVSEGALPAFLGAVRGLLLKATFMLVILAVLLAGAFLYMGEAHWLGLLTVTVIFSILSGYNSALGAIFNAARRRAVVALHGGLEAGLKIVLVIIVLSWAGASSAAVIAAFSVALLAALCSQLIVLARSAGTRTSDGAAASRWARQIWAYSWPMAAGGLFNWGYYASQRWALELFASTREVGHFYALTQVAYAPVSVAGAMALSFITPILFARVGGASDEERIRGTQHLIMRLAAFGLGATLICSLVSVFAHETLFRLLVAAEYRGVSAYMPYVVLAAGILQVSQSVGVLVAIENETARILPLAVVGNALTAMMNLWFTREWGLSGLIVSMVAGAALHLTWMSAIASKNVFRRRMEVTR